MGGKENISKRKVSRQRDREKGEREGGKGEREREGDGWEPSELF